jgi:hypothetical protein
MATLGQKFWALILLGTISLVVLPTFSRISYCEPSRESRPRETNEQLAREQTAIQQSQENSIGLYEQQSNGDYQPSSKGYEQITWFCDISVADIGLMFFTYCLVIVGWAGIKSNEQTVRAIERPWLFIESISANGLINLLPGGKILIATTVINAGRSPVILKRFRGAGIGNVVAADPARIPLSELPIEGIIGNAIAPGQNYTLKGTLRVPISAEVHTGVMNDQVKFVVRNVLEYEDQFGALHETAYCVCYDATKKRFVTHGGRDYNYTT